MPAQKRVGPDDLGQFAEAFSAQHLALDGQASTLVVVEQNAALAERFSEYLILSQKILDRVLLVSVDPTGQDQEQLLPGPEHEVHG